MNNRCEHGGVYVLDFAHQSTRLSKCPLCELDAVLQGQEVLKAQTVRIRAALTDEPHDGVDTEQIAKEIVGRLKDAQEAARSAADQLGIAESKLDHALGALREIVDLPLAPSERTAATRRIMHVALRGMEPPK